METVLTQLSIIKIMGVKPNFSELARMYGKDRRTIKKYYQGYEGKPNNRKKNSKLDKYASEIQTKMEIVGTTIRAVYEFFIDKRIEIGSYSNFNRYVKFKGFIKKVSSGAHPRFETACGKQAQVDFKEDIPLYSRDKTKYVINIFSYKLGNSRYCHFKYTKGRTRQDVFLGLISAFKNAGGVPSEVLFDNMRSVVDIDANRRKVNQKMIEFAKDFGFKVKLCKPRNAQTKGKVESANKFMDWLLPYSNEFDTEEDLIKIIEHINEKVNTQVNQATNVPPILLFQKEKEYLQPLPSKKIIESYLDRDITTTVHKDSMINFKGKRYSVSPKYIDKVVSLKILDNELQIYHNTDLIALHQISDKKLNYLDEHYKQLLSCRIPDSSYVEELAKENLRQMDELLF